MVQKSENLKIALIIPSNNNWIGEVNYFKSLVGVINSFNKSLSTKFFIFTSQNEKNIIQSKFKKVKIIKTNILNNRGFWPFLKKFTSFLFKSYDPMLANLLKKYSINVLSHYKPIKGFKNISWFPDFQHIYFRNFFTKKEIDFRNKLYNFYLENSDQVIVSSYSSKKDLIHFKKIDKKINVLRFVPEINFKKIKKKTFLKKEINLKKKIIFVPNQFWVHKNHDCVIEALKILKKKNLYIQCIFTGSKLDHRKPHHFNDLMKKIRAYNLGEQIKYLGILPYDKVINLLYHSEIVINPSFFEGWSTTVEEAKIFNKRIILSDIRVHKEQNPKKGIFFNPRNPQDLADKILKLIFLKNNKNINLNKLIKNYDLQRKIFFETYIKMIKEISIS